MNPFTEAINAAKAAREQQQLSSSASHREETPHSIPDDHCKPPDFHRKDTPVSTFESHVDNPQQSCLAANNSRPFVCSHCGAGYTEPKSLQKHLKDGHKIKQPNQRQEQQPKKIPLDTYNCQFCWKQYHILVCLKKHEKVCKIQTQKRKTASAQIKALGDKDLKTWIMFTELYGPDERPPGTPPEGYEEYLKERWSGEPRLPLDSRPKGQPVGAAGVLAPRVPSRDTALQARKPILGNGAVDQEKASFWQGSIDRFDTPPIITVTAPRSPPTNGFSTSSHPNVGLPEVSHRGAQYAQPPQFTHQQPVQYHQLPSNGLTNILPSLAPASVQVVPGYTLYRPPQMSLPPQAVQHFPLSTSQSHYNGFTAEQQIVQPQSSQLHQPPERVNESTCGFDAEYLAEIARRLGPDTTFPLSLIEQVTLAKCFLASFDGKIGQSTDQIKQRSDSARSISGLKRPALMSTEESAEQAETSEPMIVDEANYFDTLDWEPSYERQIQAED